jgi:hypothetical protein
MPYMLEYVGKNKYYVITQHTGRRHSLEPLPKAKAEAQIRALYARTANEPGIFMNPK